MSDILINDELDMGTLRVVNNIDARDNLGRFTFKIEEANRRSTAEAVRAGAGAARSAAPKKTGQMAASISSRLSPSPTPTATSIYGKLEVGEIRVRSPHWKYIQFGAKRHPIPGWVRFFWANQGRFWTPGHNLIDHPGTKAVPFMTIGYQVAKERLIEAMRRNYRS